MVKKYPSMFSAILDVRTDYVISLNTGQILKGKEVKNMVNADDYYGEYLKADDLKADVRVRVEKANIETIDGDNKVVVSLLGFKKRFVLNKTNKDRLKQLFGSSETDQWVDKEFTLGKEQVNYKGEEVPALRVKVIKPAD